MSREDEEKAIEATKAPLMDHLIELRSRLIKAVAAFALAAVVCFFFAKQIYNVLTWPYVWVAGPENSKFIYTGLLEYFIVQLKLAMFGAAFISFPITTFSAIIFGAATGLTWLSTVPPTSALVALMFGTRWFSPLYGFAFVSHGVGGFLGVLLGGIVFEKFGSYAPLWWLSVVFGVLSALINLPIVEKPVPRAVPAI